MCEYCNFENFYGVPWVVHEPIKMNNAHIFDAQVILTRDGFYDSQKKGAYISTVFDTIDSEKILECNTPIKYCPFCGRKLSEE